MRILWRRLRALGARLLTCFTARDRGTCTNRRSIKRQEVEARVLRAMRERLLDDGNGAFTAFCQGFLDEMKTRRQEHVEQMAGARRELEKVRRRQKEITDAIAEGYRCEECKAELITLDTRKAALTAALAEPPLTALHPNMANLSPEGDDPPAAGRRELRRNARCGVRSRSGCRGGL